MLAGDGGPAGDAVLEGRIAVEAALRARRRPVHQVWIAQDRDEPRLHQLAMAAGARVRRVPPDDLAAAASGRTHGGVLAFVGPRRHETIEELIDGVANPLLVLLDGFEDPYNYGHAVRALYAFGVDGLIVRPRDWTAVTGIVTRASAGATEHLPTALAPDPVAAVAAVQRSGLIVVCATEDRKARPLPQADLTGPLCLVIGGEKRGLSRQLRQRADTLVRIPYARPFDHSLGLTAAASALAYEVTRQRQAAQPAAGS